MRTAASTLWILPTLVVLLTGVSVSRGDDLDALQEKAVKDAVRRVAPSVVKIETSGGTEVVKSGRGPGAVLRKGTGPTTGVLVSTDGYIISSAFNFANKPTSILVSIPGLKERLVARVVAQDMTRMLTLLRVSELPAGTRLNVPVAVPRKEVVIGMTAIAVGRTLATEMEDLPSVSVGIVSAVDRIWGKAIQTDAKVSPVNYGGPLIDLQGRVLGILVPASPQAEGETAGFEWYDSGIGFAMPLEDVFAVLPRMVKGTEKEPVTLKRGFLGITWRSTDMYEALPIIGTVMPGSAAEKAGLKSGDQVIEVEGKPVINTGQVQHVLGRRYEGDFISLKVLRDKKEIELPRIELGNADTAYPEPFLGILPIRDDPDPGVEIRFVYPGSPADKVGLKPGDRILKVGIPLAPPGTPMVTIQRGREQLHNVLAAIPPGIEMSLEVKRKANDKTETVKLKLDTMPDRVPAKLPENSTARKALVRPGPKAPDKKDKDKEDKPKAPAAKPETGLLKRTSPAADNTYWVYVPDNYDPNISYGLLLWLHPLGKNKEKDFDDFTNTWANFCEDNHLIIVCPQSDNPRGWTPGEADFVVEAVRMVASTYTIDQQRIVAHGMGVGGEMALYLGFKERSLIRGVATVGSALGSNLRERQINQPLSFYLVVGGKDPVKPAVVQTRERLQQLKYSVILSEIANNGHEYIDGRAGIPTLEELVRWIDSLDRM